MINLRKFYDPAVAEAPAAMPAERPSIASLMATKGVMNSSDTPVATPIEITEPVKEAEPAATATPVSNAESTPTTKETPLPTEEPKPAEVQREPEQVKVPTWQEVLKSQQPDTILKEMGFDEKAIRLANKLKGFEKIDFFNNLINTWETNGNVNGYLQQLSTDYTKMSAEDVMRHQLRQEYPKASDKALEAIYEDEIVEKYKLDSERFTEAEVERGRLLLEAKADKYRDTLIENQQQYLFPKPPEAKPQEPDNSAEEAKQAFEAYRSQVIDSSFTKDIKASGKLSIGDGEDRFSYPVQVEELIDTLLDSEKWQETQFDIVRNPDGSIKSYTPKVEHQLLTAAVAKYGKAFLNEYAKHFKALGGKAAIDPIDNAKPPENGVPAAAEVAPKTAAEAMAKQGTLNSGGYNR